MPISPPPYPARQAVPWRKKLPLARRRLFHSRDLDEARERVAAVFCPHRLDTVGRRGLFDARQHHLPGHRLSLNYIEYGARTLIEPGALGSFYLLQIPLEHGARIENGDDAYDSTPERAAVLNPHLPTRMDWAEGTCQLLVQIDRDTLQAQAAAHLGVSPDRPITFRGGLDLRTDAGLALRRIVMWLVAETDSGRPPIGRGLMARAIEEAVIAGVLEACDAPPPIEPATPRHLRKAEAFIRANLDRTISVGDMAAAAGISRRALQATFRAHRGTTPLGYWRDLRLDGARTDLASARPGTTVTDAALCWGFQHFGRFAEAYRRRFGELPSETLRRSEDCPVTKDRFLSRSGPHRVCRETAPDRINPKCSVPRY
jgi:AraC-like DNA-binding protein